MCVLDVVVMQGLSTQDAVTSHVANVVSVCGSKHEWFWWSISCLLKVGASTLTT